MSGGGAGSLTPKIKRQTPNQFFAQDQASGNLCTERQQSRNKPFVTLLVNSIKEEPLMSPVFMSEIEQASQERREEVEEKTPEKAEPPSRNPEVPNPKSSVNYETYS